MQRRFRLTSSTDFKRVRRIGKSYAHPLIVLIAAPNGLETSRFGIAASRSVGKAVRRNRVKRLMREALRPLIASIKPGWDILLLARQPMVTASFNQVEEALVDLHRRARLLEQDHGNH